MHKQNEIGLKIVIRDIGCFFLSCVNLVEFKTGLKLSVKEVNELWDFCKRNNIIDKNDDVVSSAKIMNRILKIKNSDLRCYEIATQKQGVKHFYKGISNEIKNMEHYYIQKLQTDGKYGTHFRVITENGNIFDTYDRFYYFDKVLYNIVYCFI